MYVRALLPTSSVEAAMLVPQQAVSRDSAGHASVLVVGSGNKLERRTIDAERAIGNRWLVTTGLKPGERVVVEGLQKVRPGDVVQAQTVAAAASAPASAAAR
jgi:membrane fusion protein (multidrug efflux system)